MSGTRIKFLVDSLLEGFQIISPDWRYLYVNDAVAKQARCSKEQLLGKKMMEVFPGIEGTAMFALLKECMEKRSFRRMENEFIFPNGSKGWFELSFEPVPEGVTIMSIEITERKLAEEHSQHLARVLMAIHNVNQLLVTERDRQVLLDKACEKLVDVEGYQRAWIVLVDPKGNLTHSADILGPSWLGPAGKGMIDATGGMAACVREALTRTGVHIRNMESSEMPGCKGCSNRLNCRLMLCRLETKGTIHGVLGMRISENLEVDEDELALITEVVGDISCALDIIATEEQRDKGAQRLQESEEKIKAILNNINDFIYFRDMEGRLQEVNLPLCDLLGYSREELLGMRLKDIYMPEKALELPKLMQLANNDGHVLFETEYQKRDGQAVPVEVSAKKAVIAGNTAFVGVARDITQRKRVEALMKQKDRLEIFSFLASALPAFASNLPANVRNMFVSTFAGLFEKNVRPRYEEFIKGMEAREGGAADSSKKALDYQAWASNFFSNLGMEVRTSKAGGIYRLEFGTCPWAELSQGNPVFCLLCRTMAVRSYSWTDLPGEPALFSTIAEGSKECSFSWGRAKD